MATNLPMDLLRCFVTIVDLGGLTRAGEALGRSQPAISQQLKRLEELAGSQLIWREGREFALTETGERLIVYARQILFLNDEAVSRLIKSKVKGRVRVGLPNDFAVTFLPEILGRFKETHADITLEVDCDISKGLLERLKQGDFDLVIALGAGDLAETAAKIWNERLAWVAGPGTAAGQSDPMPLIAYPEGCIYRQHATQALNRAGRAWRVTYSSSSLSGIFAAVEAGLGVTVLAESTIPGRLQRLSVEEGFPGLPDVEVGIHYNPERLSDSALRLINYAIAAMDERYPAAA